MDGRHICKVDVGDAKVELRYDARAKFWLEETTGQNMLNPGEFLVDLADVRKFTLARLRQLIHAGCQWMRADKPTDDIVADWIDAFSRDGVDETVSSATLKITSAIIAGFGIDLDKLQRESVKAQEPTGPQPPTG